MRDILFQYIRIRIIQILQDMPDNHITCITRVIKIRVFSLVKYLINPRYLAILYQFIKIEASTEQACDTIIIVTDSRA